MEDYAIISALKDQEKIHNGKSINDITEPSHYNPFQNKPIYYIQSDINKIKADVECMKLDIKEILRRLSKQEKSENNTSSSWW